MAGTRPQKRVQKSDPVTTYTWLPQPRQLRFLRAAGCAHLWGFPDEPIADEVLYGGAAGGG